VETNTLEILNIDIGQSSMRSIIGGQFERIMLTDKLFCGRWLTTVKNNMGITDIWKLFPNSVLLSEYKTLNTLEVVFKYRDVLWIVIATHDNSDGVVSWEGRVAGNNSEDVEEASKYFSSAFSNECPIDNSKNQNFFCFWHLQPNGSVVNSWRLLDVPSWPEVKSNYNFETSLALDGLINSTPVVSGGKLILLHGQPGTGKTNFIKALGWEWRDFCSLDYIIDAEQFFEKPAYMIEVLSKDKGDNKFKLIIIEDADEFLKQNAKERQGQLMSRLLNLTDGILGQGLKVVLLITTNEPLSEIHEAVSRPGRCLANIEFLPFNKQDAINWLKEKEIDTTNDNKNLDKNVSLAQLYEVLNKNQVKYSQPKTTPGQYI
jgi:hypothetical protein